MNGTGEGGGTRAGRVAGWGLVAALVLVVALAWLCRGDGSLDRLRERGAIRVGYAVEAPYAFVDSGQSAPTGESPRIAALIAERLGIPAVQWRQCEFGALIDELEQGRIDVIAAGMFVTPARAERIAFSRPTFQVSPGLLVGRGNPLDLHGYGPFGAGAAVRLAALAGSVEASLLRDVAGVRLIEVPDAAAGRAAVETGAADGLALSSPTIQWMALHDRLGQTEVAHPFEVGAEPTRQGRGAFGFRREDEQLRAAWDAELARFVGSPEHLALVAPFGFTRADLPAEVR